MDIVNVLLDPILPVFLIIAVGYGFGRAGKTTFDEARVINKVAMNVFLPIMIFGLIANAPIYEFNALAVLSYLIVEVIVFFIGYLIARRICNRSKDESVLLAFCGIFANNAFYVLPISLLLYGEAGVLPITTVITLDATITFGGAMIALQVFRLGRVSPVEVASSLLRTPVLQAIVLGLVASLLQVEIPSSVNTFLTFNGAATAPIALFALGVVMSQTAFKLDSTVTIFTGIKLIVFPALVALTLSIFGLLPGKGDLFLLASAGPAGTMAFSLALFHNVKTDAIVMIMVCTSVLTLLTLAALA
ncbi:MAG: malonate transporter [Granulosicoccus sp.]